MANAKFYLKDKKSKTETPINLHFYFNYSETDKTGKKKYKFLKYYTGEKINPKFWNFDKQRVKETKAFSEYPEFNTRIRDIEESIFDLYRKLKNDNVTPTPEILKERLLLHYNKLSKPTKEPHLYSLIDFIENYIKESKTHKSKGTIIIYEITLMHLKNYIQNRRLKTLDFDNVDLDFYYDFLDYQKVELNHSTNTIGKHIKTLKTFINDATERNFNTNLAYRSKKFKTPRATPEKIYLTEEELTAIYDLDLSNNPKLDKVRDLFIIGCYTALRFSDFTRIKKENVFETEGGRILKFRTQKTNEIIEVPIHYRFADILKKYKNSIPPTISNQKMNVYIKEVGKLANIDTSVLIYKEKGNLAIEKKVKKHEQITTHTARRSGATNMFKMGISPIRIMQITGHKTESSFMTYIRITQEENAKTLINHKYYKRPLKIVK